MTERTALKEWAVLVDAMARGDLIALVRKGGIREQRAGFAVRHERFLFYPTYFHEKQQELAPRFVPTLAASHATQPPAGTVRLDHVADVAGLWWVTDLDRLHAIEPEVGLNRAAIESRYHYRDNPGVHVIAARVSRLTRPIEVPEAPRYAGCVSWVELDADVDLTGATPVLDDAQFTTRLAALTAALGTPEAARV
jgi:hypothetical protein